MGMSGVAGGQSSLGMAGVVIVVHPRVERGWLIWLSGLYVCQKLAFRNRDGFYIRYAIFPSFPGIHLRKILENAPVA